jgi:hypothetical protein
MAENLVALELDFFDPEPNVPEPLLIESELECYLVYNNRSGERVAIRFLRCSVTQFGYPNDEALGGHRLYNKGLQHYGCYEVIDSEWIAGFQCRNKVVYPERDIMQKARHFIFSFHDSTFECVASGVERANEFPQLDSSMMRVFGV